jgi:hypothetical protein
MLVICCGMPRSGSTLQFNVISEVLNSKGKGRKVDWASPKQIVKDAAQYEEYAKDTSSYYIVKSHEPPEFLFGLCAENVFYVYVDREPKDAIASMKVKFNYSVPQGIRKVSSSWQLKDRICGLGSGQYLLQDYVKLRDELPIEISRVAAFFGIVLTEQELLQITEKLSLDKAYDRSRKKRLPFEHLWRRVCIGLGLPVRFADDELRLHPKHVSDHKGASEIWQKILTPEEVELIHNELKL